MNMEPPGVRWECLWKLHCERGGGKRSEDTAEKGQVGGKVRDRQGTGYRTDRGGTGDLQEGE